ncbi:MAG TPA: glycosyltransferase family 4 protein [Puia sp.]|nr:glycosyltransferase family 4 protein [Puia sp.]
MHNITKIKIFRILLRISWFPSLILIYPFALFRRKSRTGLFFFFDRYAMGGAQRIHLDILKSVNDVGKDVFFTRRSPNRLFKDEFYSLPNTHCSDFHFWCDNLFFRLFTVHYFGFYINRHPNARVFGANSTFFYDLLPFIRRSVIKIELLHNFTFGKKGMEFFGLMNHQFLDHRVIYDSFTLENIKKQYREFGIDESWLNRIDFIEPGVDIPAPKQKSFEKPLKVLCAGRGGPQKRIWLINRIAEYFLNNRLPVIFHFAGNLIGEVPLNVRQQSVVHGEISDPDRMASIQDDCDIALLTSAYEGFPMFIKESMAHGCIPVVTALPGNLMHLKDQFNALLIRDIQNEDEVVVQGIANIEMLINDIALCKRLSANAYTYASEHFTRNIFIKRYRSLLESDR